MSFLESMSATELDAADSLRYFRDEFWLPGHVDGNSQIYFVGNSLGLQPKKTFELLNEELENWRRLGVRGHFSGRFPWMPYHEFLTSSMAFLVGARDEEVVMMNSLTVNLHLMLATFFQPTGRRTKILIENHAFPSDHYAVESHLRFRGLDPVEHMVLLPDNGSAGTWTTAEIVNMIEQHRDELALVLLPGVQYYTGQVFDIPVITESAHANGALVGFDLAHAAGNLRLHLHDWEPDFAVWCSYKYLNGGPGSVGGCFVHQRHSSNRELPRLAGWWGHNKKTRFLMQNQFDPIPTAEGWQLSNPPILSLAVIGASLEVFRRAGGMEPLNRKSQAMNRFFRQQIQSRLSGRVQILTPEPSGCQLSLRILSDHLTGRQVKERLDQAGIETDWREPDVIRAAPVPLYNQFSEIETLVNLLDSLLK